MKHISFFLTMALLGVLAANTACSKGGPTGPKLYTIDVQLIYPLGSGAGAHEGVNVRLGGSSDLSLTAVTDADGKTSFRVPAGIYKLYVSEKAGNKYFNGSSQVTVTAADSRLSCELKLGVSRTSPLIIKELYCGGCPKDEGTGAYANDKYVILYNNSSDDVLLNDVCMAMVYPYSSTLTTNYDYVDGKLSYEEAGTSPAGLAFWSFDASLPVILEAGKQVVVALSDALNHTTTYSRSVDLSRQEYYVAYDSEATKNHTAPAESIPPAHYLKVWNYGLTGNWAMDRTSPAFFIFSAADGASLKDFFEDESNVSLYNNKNNFKRKMVPAGWVMDAIEVFVKDNEKNKKRLSSAVDMGAVEMIGQLGYTLYRNVDKEATEAIEGNQEKLVYNYQGGVEDQADPSGIDAEASLAAGAVIRYRDSNDSSKDFHLRKNASLKN